jgi:HD superfamily phosphohydrolase
MALRPKAQRIRDPLHNLIQFDSTQFEQTLWRVIQTTPFQRLRRVRQLGFSELVFPGANHTRFGHSVGAYETARHLMRIIEQHIKDSGRQVQDHQKNVALAAALVHDVGHGMFSHAFEEVGKKLKLKMAEHEHVSDLLIREGEIGDSFTELGSGFANDVATVIGRGRPGNLYDAVVSSQFDADRLDYMQRDRLMTGVQNSGIDFLWLMNNLEIGEIPMGADDEQSGTIETFVIGSKAIHAAETYVLALFQLYPTVYFHKATRGAEKLFSAIMTKLFELVRDNSAEKTGLPRNHPILRFARDPEKIENVLALDDTVFWGALPMLKEAEDCLIREFSNRLWTRKLFKCIDIKQNIVAQSDLRACSSHEEILEREKRLTRLAVSVKESIDDWLNNQTTASPRLLIDEADRHPYKSFQESKGPLNQISIRSESGEIVDLAAASPVVARLKPFSLFRVYHESDDKEVQSLLSEIIREKLRSENG